MARGAQLNTQRASHSLRATTTEMRVLIFDEPDKGVSFQKKGRLAMVTIFMCRGSFLPGEGFRSRKKKTSSPKAPKSGVALNNGEVLKAAIA